MTHDVLETHLLGLIVLFPALGALLWGTVGRWLPRRLVGAGATLAKGSAVKGVAMVALGLLLGVVEGRLAEAV